MQILSEVDDYMYISWVKNFAKQSRFLCVVNYTFVVFEIDYIVNNVLYENVIYSLKLNAL